MVLLGDCSADSASVVWRMTALYCNGEGCPPCEEVCHVEAGCCGGRDEAPHAAGVGEGGHEFQLDSEGDVLKGRHVCYQVFGGDT